MKNNLYLPLFLIILMLFTGACEKEPADYTYTITAMDWVNSGSDEDLDGYVTNRSVELILTLAEDVQRDVEIRIYYKLSETREYIFYSKSTREGLTGNGTENILVIQLGTDPELPHGTYDFLIEILETESQRVEASREISGARFERLIHDMNYDMKIWWTGHLDYDRDSFPRFATLNLDVNISTPETREIRVEVLYRPALSDAAYHSLYQSSYAFITGEEPDTIAVQVGTYPDTLSQGTYDFQIVVRERNRFNPVLIYDRFLSDELKDIPFETEWQDGYTYSINTENTVWRMIIDQDGDGYSRSRVLRLDMDIDKNETIQVLAKIFRKGALDEDFLVMDSTGIFEISGASVSDTVLIPLNHPLTTDSVMMSHGEWNLMIGVFEVLAPDYWELRFATDSIDGTFLQKQKFERAEEDEL